MKFYKNESVKFTRVKRLKLRRRRIKILTIGAMVIAISLYSHQFSMQTKDNFVYEPNTTPEYNQVVEQEKKPIAVDKDFNNTEENTPSAPITSNDEELSSTENNKTINEEIIEEEETEEIIEKPVIEITNDKEIESSNNEEIIEPEIKPQKKMIALSYDDGPSKTLTLELLEVLKENNCTATFFVLGNRVKQYSDIIYELHSAGNKIGNHSYDHSDLSKLNKEQIANQFRKTEEAIYEIVGEYPVFFRPPYGALSSNVKEVIESPLVLWSIDSNDWRSISDEEVINNVISSLDDGKIILMHDIHKRTIEVSKILIPMIKELGYEIVSIEELFENNKIELEDGVVYSKVKKN